MNLTVDGDSDYTTTGSPDTFTAVSDGSGGTEAVSEQINGVCTAVVELQALLGDALDLKGSVADLVTRLARNLDTNGTLPKGNAFPTMPSPVEGQMFYRQDLDSLYIFNGVSWLTVTQGTAQGTIDHGSLGGLDDPEDHPWAALVDMSRVLTGDPEIKKNTPRLRLKGTEASAQEYALTESGGDLRLERNDGSESVPSWTTLNSLLNVFFPVPTGTGSGSSSTYGGDFTSSGDANLSGVNFYNTFHLQAGHTYTVPVGKRCVVIVAKTSITIDGTITAAGAGASGGAGGSSSPTAPIAGSPGTDQPGGGGGGVGAAGGPVWLHGISVQAGGAPGYPGATGTQLTASEVARGWSVLSSLLGGGGGGGGNGSGSSGGSGGAGGGSIILIAPVINFAATAVLNTSGSNATAAGGGVGDSGGGGGGAGNIWLVYRQLTDLGATFTQTGGVGSAAGGGGGGAAGGNGAAGVIEKLVLQ